MAADRIEKTIDDIALAVARAQLTWPGCINQDCLLTCVADTVDDWLCARHVAHLREALAEPLRQALAGNSKESA